MRIIELLWALMLIGGIAIAAEYKPPAPRIDKTKVAELKKTMAKENCDTKFVAMRKEFPPKSDDVVRTAVAAVFPECKQRIAPPEPALPESQLAPIPREAVKPGVK